MAWTAPMTAVAGSVFTAAQYNTFIRDNMVECPASKALTPGGYFTTSDTNQVTERVTAEAAVETSEGTTSTTYTALATAGPAVTVTTGNKALVWVTADLVCGTAGQSARTTFNVSGATTVAESDPLALRNVTNAVFRATAGPTTVALTPGSNTFTMTYRTSGASTSTFANRRIVVMPF